MVFSSLLFLFRFLPAVLILYYIAPRKLRNVILLLFSLFFYVWGEPKYVFLMLFTITMDFFIGKGIDKAKKEGNQKKAKRFLMTSILVDLSILGFFKYADFLIDGQYINRCGNTTAWDTAADRYFFFYVSDNVIHD